MVSFIPSVARSKADNLLFGGSLIEYVSDLSTSPIIIAQQVLVMFCYWFIQARVEQWMDFAATEVDTNIAKWLYPRLGFMPYIPAVSSRIGMSAI